MDNRKHTTRVWSFVNAVRGITAVLKAEQNARVHLAITLIVVTLGFSFKISVREWLMIILCIGMVMMAEIFNTAIERLVDMVSPDFHPKAGKVKDMSAGAVLIAAIISVITGVIIFLPYLIELIRKLTKE